MARFNTIQSTISVTGATTLTYVIDKSTILLTGSPGYTLTLANPSAFPGSVQTIYNATGGNVTIATPAGNLIGNGFTSGSSQTIPNNTTYAVTSNSTDYVITNNQGGPISVTTATFSGTVSMSPTGTVTINPSVAGTINNMSIGATTRSSGAFTTLAANNSVTLNNITIAQNTGIITTSSGNLTLDAANGSTISVSKALSMGSNQITSSYAPTSSNDLTNKTYVDARASKISAAGLYYGS